MFAYTVNSNRSMSGKGLIYFYQRNNQTIFGEKEKWYFKTDENTLLKSSRNSALVESTFSFASHMNLAAQIFLGYYLQYYYLCIKKYF